MTLVFAILEGAWDIFRESAFYMLFGFALAGAFRAFIPQDRIGCLLGEGKVRPVILAALLGIPLPICSCGVVPAAAGLRKQGANRGATLSFLISTPETGADSIPVTYALLDPVMTVIRPVSAFFTAVAAGIAENFLHRDPPEVEPAAGETAAAPACTGACACREAPVPPATPLDRLRGGIRYAFTDLFGDIAVWFLGGVLLAGIISVVIPTNIAESVSRSHPFLVYLAMLVAGIPTYVCATASTPIAAALILKGISPGAALVFLLSGPATNAATLSMVSGLLGKSALGVYLGSIAVFSLGFGALTDLLYSGLDIPVRAVSGHAGELLPGWVEAASTMILSLLLIKALLARFRTRRKPVNRLVSMK